jgi:hypothetical protein
MIYVTKKNFITDTYEIFSTWSDQERSNFYIIQYCFFSRLKGRSHEKVGEMRVQGNSLGPN